MRWRKNNCSCCDIFLLWLIPAVIYSYCNIFLWYIPAGLFCKVLVHTVWRWCDSFLLWYIPTTIYSYCNIFFWYIPAEQLCKVLVHIVGRWCVSRGGNHSAVTFTLLHASYLWYISLFWKNSNISDFYKDILKIWKPNFVEVLCPYIFSWIRHQTASDVVQPLHPLTSFLSDLSDPQAKVLHLQGVWKGGAKHKHTATHRSETFGRSVHPCDLFEKMFRSRNALSANT